MTFKYRFIVLLALALLSVQVNAKPKPIAQIYVNTYVSHVVESQSKTGNETRYQKTTPLVLMGFRSTSFVGVSIDMLFDASGMGASAGLYVGNRDWRFNAGLITLTDSSTGRTPTYSNIGSGIYAKGHYIGLDYKMLSLRYLIYDADHIYVKTGVIKKGVNGEKDVIGILSQSSDVLTRNVLMLGLNFQF